MNQPTNPTDPDTKRATARMCARRLKQIHRSLVSSGLGLAIFKDGRLVIIDLETGLELETVDRTTERSASPP